MAIIEARVKTVDGWLNRAEGRLLYRLAKGCSGKGVIVEIGSWKGKSTIWLGHGTKDGCNAEIHAIDPHTGSPEHQRDTAPVWTFDEFQQNIRAAGVDEIIVPHVDYSEAVARGFNKPVELVFIDGQHEYEAVNADFQAWFPKVVDGGVVAFHDTTGWPGPRTVVTESLFKSRQFKKVRFVKSITYGVKTAQNTFLERAANRWNMWLFLSYAFVYRHLWKLNRDLKGKIPALRFRPV